MVRYGAQHKRETRERIIDRAGRRFKVDGIDGTGIATLMSDAGLTNGAFYAHFDSKDDLVATVLSEQVRHQREKYGAGPLDRQGFERFLRHYLSVEHRDAVADGCPSAALLDEAVRATDEARRRYTDGLRKVIDDIAAVFAPQDDRLARARAAAIFASMIGTLQLSRAVVDQELADDVLTQGIENALTLLDLVTSNEPVS